MATMATTEHSETPLASSSITITHRTECSVLTYLLHALLRPLSSTLTKQRKVFPPGSPRLDIPSSTRRHCTVTERKLSDIYIYEIVSHDSPTQAKAEKSTESLAKVEKRIYYFAGGGWRAPPSGEHWTLAVEIARKLKGAAVTLVSYPLAPESPAPMAFPGLQALYTALLKESRERGERVVLAGDSAGGNLVLALTLAAVSREGDGAVLLPDAIMAISPSVDCRRSNPAIEKVAPNDPILRVSFIKETARGWRGEWDASDTRISPLLAGEAAFQTLARRDVKIHGMTGGFDILCPDALLFRDACARSGIRGEWLHWDRQMHVWPLTWKYGLREGREAKDWMLDVLSRC